MPEPSEFRSSNRGSFSKEEKRRIGLAHQLIYVFPFFAGLITVSVGVMVEHTDRTKVEFALTLALIVNAGLAGSLSAFSVARLHAVERGKWWRAGTSFLFAVVMTVFATVCWGMFAGCTGLVR